MNARFGVASDLRAGGANLRQEAVGPEGLHDRRLPNMNWTASARPSREELALIRKTLKAHPGCSIVMKRGPDGEREVRLRRISEAPTTLAALKRRVRLSELQREAEDRYRSATGFAAAPRKGRP